jgi:hypothetical protein
MHTTGGPNVLRRGVKSALYVDWANMSAKFPSRTLLDGLSAWTAWLEDGKFDPTGKRRNFLEKRAYINTTFLRQIPALEAAGFEVIPSSDDMLIALDMADSFHENQPIKEYVLLTVDEDFLHLLERLGERGKKRVVTIGPIGDDKYPCTRVFPSRSEITIPLNDLQTAFHYERRGFIHRLTLRLRPRIGRWFPPTSKEVQTPAIAHNNPRLLAIAEHLATLAHSKSGVAVGRSSVLRYLQKNMPDFRPYRYRHRGKYNRLLQQVVAIRNDLQLVRNAKGGLAIMVPRGDDPKSVPL